MDKYTDTRAMWTTGDELLYLRGLPRRDGCRMGEHRGGTVDARSILESWLATYRKREWPVTVDVAKCHLMAIRLIEEMEG